jgi:hypothetical protein
MSTFQPSEHSHFGDLGLAWSDLNPFSSSSSTPKVSAQDAASAEIVKAQNAARGSAKATGNYTDGKGYTYFYNANDKSIQIIISPRSTRTTAVVAGSTEYNAILAQIQSGVAVPVAAPVVEAQKAAKVSSSGGASNSVVAEAPAAMEEAFYQKTWFPYAVLGTVTVIGVLAVLLWPSKKKVEHAAAAPRRQRQLERKPEYDEEYEAEPA